MRLSSGLYAAILSLPMFLPIIENPKLAPFLILHSGTGVALLILPLALALAVVLTKIKPDSVIADSEKVTLINKAIVGLALAGLGSLALVGVKSYNTMREELALKNEGRTAVAHVEEFYTDSCSKHGCSDGVRYSYTVGGQRFEGHYRLGRNYSQDATYEEARNTRSIPIVYDVSDPSNSEVNFNNRILKVNPQSSFRLSIELFGFLIVFVFGMLIWMLVVRRSAIYKANLESSFRHRALPQVDAKSTTASSPTFGRRQSPRNWV